MIRPYAKYRSGLTLIEILVASLILAVLAALLLIAVSEAREAARRSQCLNQMRRIILGTNLHLDQKNYYPRGENNYSAFVSILPFLEQSTLYNSINLTNPRKSFQKPGDVNLTAFSIHLSVFVCPSIVVADDEYGPTSYGGNLGFGAGRYGRPDNGPFASSLLDPKIRDALIRDGLANTIAISEFNSRIGSNVRQENGSVFQLQSFKQNDFSAMIDQCQSLNWQTNPLAIVYRGWCWAFDGTSNTLYDHDLPPNTHTCSSGGALTGAWTASSMHREGVNCAHLDGHVSFTKNSISLQLWRSLGTMNGGEILEANH